MKKKILFFSHESLMYGAPRSLLIMAEGLKDIYDVQIITFGEGDIVDAAKSKDIDIKVIEKSFFSSVNGSSVFSKIFRRIGRFFAFIQTAVNIHRSEPDLVYINTIFDDWPLRLGNLFGIRFIVHVREGKDYIFPSNPYRKKITDRFFKHTNHFVCVSDSIKSLVVKRLDGRKARVDRIYNGIDCEQFNQFTASSLPLPDFSGKTVVGYLGNIKPRKGLDVFLSSAKYLSNKRSDTVFLAVGGDRESFEALAKDLGIFDLLGKKIFYLPFVKQPQAAFKLFDIYCMTSLIEPFARVNLEAACLMTPIIATDIDGNREFIIDGKTGVLVPPGDVDALAQAMEKLIDNSLLRHQLAENAYHRVINVFSEERYISESKSIIDEVLAK
ncbi:MAG: glycosyltransferase family 4 protein [Candidatus Paceibacterota bacterium]